MPALEFLLDPAEIPRLAQWPGLRASRAFPADITWLDSAEGDLAAGGLALAKRASSYRLTLLRPPVAIIPPATLAEAPAAALLNHDLPSELLAQARLRGKRQTFCQSPPHSPPVELQLLQATIEDQPSHHPPFCRLTLEGPTETLTSLALSLTEGLALQVPRWGLAEQVLAATRGAEPPPRALGAPQISDGPVTESLTTIAGHLTDTMLHWAHQVPTAPSPEPVHQMRVATRRLRSALSLYKHVAACPELASVAVPLKLCAGRLGTARDWDVFLEGIGARLAESFPGDARCTAMLRAAARRRRTAYADLKAFLAGADFRTLTVALACATALRPWESSAPEAGLRQDTTAFAATVLGNRLRTVRKAGRHIETLTVPALHELRKKCKRLRYAAEFFAPLFGHKRAKRFIARLSDLQEELGLLNDGAAVSGLMAQLGRVERSYAAGLVEGFSAASAESARARIHHAWKQFRTTAPFWPA